MSRTRESDPAQRERLQRLVRRLGTSISSKSLTRQTLLTAIDSVKELGYEYDSIKFPPLPASAPVPGAPGAPVTLAELLIWKLGKWTAYTRFCEFYRSDAKRPQRSNSAVFDAFALHLKNRDYPIFDQHSLRAIWGICKLTASEHAHCKSFLFRGAGWKEAGSGASALHCYDIFVNHARLLQVQTDSSLQVLDTLLMPLGQALKEATATFESFCALCAFE